MSLLYIFFGLASAAMLLLEADYWLANPKGEETPVPEPIDEMPVQDQDAKRAA